MQGIFIRTAEVDDLDALGDVYRRSSLSNDGDRASLLAHPDALAFDDSSVRERRTRVAIDGQRIVGFATIHVLGNVAELDDLFVDPDWMRRGVGHRLIIDAASFARSHGIARVEVTANAHAMAFYEAAGFVLDSATETRFGPGYRMHLDIMS